MYFCFRKGNTISSGDFFIYCSQDVIAWCVLISIYILFSANPQIVVTSGLYLPIEIVRCFGCGCIAIAIFCAVLERTVATVYLDTYEQNRSYTLLIFFAFLQLSGSATFNYFFFTRKLFFEQQVLKLEISEQINWLALIIFAIVISTVTLIIFLITYYINKFRYKLCSRNIVKYTLSQRYQLSENLRAFMIMQKTILYLGVGNITIVATVLAVNFLHQKFSMLLFRALFNIIVILYSILIPIVFVTSVEIWRLKYVK